MKIFSCFCKFREATVENEAIVEDDEGRKTKYGGWKSIPYIIGNEASERVATQALASNLSIFLMRNYNMQQVTAANVSNIFSGTTNFAPLFGAFISDVFLGRFQTLAFSTIATFLGMLLLTLTTAIPLLHPITCHSHSSCPGASYAQLAILILSLTFLVVGAGGIRPTTVPFGVDQFDRTTTDGNHGLLSFFNWYYWSVNVAFLIGMSVVVYIQDSISWSIGFAIPTALLLVSTALFIVNARLYVFVLPEGTVITGILQVFVAAFVKRNLKLPCDQEASLYNNTSARCERVTKLSLSNQFRFLNKAAIIEHEGEINEENGLPINPWTLCTIQQIEEAKCMLRIIPISVCGISTFVAVSQLWTFAVLQSLTMDRHLAPHFQIPPGSLGVVSLIALILFLPLYDLFLVPFAREVTGHHSGITVLQRQGIGMAISVLSLVVAGLVEAKRRNISSSGDSFSVFWLAPQLAVVGISEAFNAVGQVEFYNMEFPEHMQTLGGSLFYLGQALASYISALVVTLVQKYTGEPSWLDDDINLGRLDYFYFLLAIYGAISLVCFLVLSHFYRYKAKPVVFEEGFRSEGEVHIKLLQHEAYDL